MEFKPANNLIRPADSHYSRSMTDKEINPSPEGADLELCAFYVPTYTISKLTNESYNYFYLPNNKQIKMALL